MAKTKQIAKELKVIGLMNIQYAIKGDQIYMLEVNPRASRTIPYVSKSIGVPLAKLAAKVMAGAKLKDLGFTKEVDISYYTVKESVFPFVKFPGTDIVLGPEMKSTGEVMGIDYDYGAAQYKAQLAAGNKLPKQGLVFISVRDKAKQEILEIAKDLQALGFGLISTSGTYKFLTDNGLEVEKVAKVHEGVRPNVVDKIKNGKIAFVINIPEGKKSRLDGESIRRVMLSYSVPYVTSLEAAKASVIAIKASQKGVSVTPIQEYYTRGK
jgi:carbamoyl-phosphate synthase large subunit